mmetsp:Transcript_7358/g.9949  ORF Transcript_7358/g.9949 Transcript_7358/m.9949 type:complete len:158 (+) Transcript_7358:436-909(+)|eukprot:CAMPEP_0196570954 /NCGR_PEP_ID=MMETSP1081-20130531/1117_1 /TAXON_ID=36882 /ORGANISM="Pyramimonas amylifera, Strain CCMP720" /LENGTH=157 /DNA_ID=CAMNT_0041887669 /DNA_START=424 /DNA_END=897 /DNA_ORIENTATION=+
MSRAIVIKFLRGLVPYSQALKMQETLAAQRLEGSIPDTLLVLQHSPVYTIGKRATVHNILIGHEELARMGAEVHQTKRGGDVTWHGPGQAVLYPILNLRELQLGARAYVEGLEDVMIQAALELGIHAHGRALGETGVWVGERKLGAVGVRISQGITE